MSFLYRKHFYHIDVLCKVESLCVNISHWQHHFFSKLFQIQDLALENHLNCFCLLMNFEVYELPTPMTGPTFIRYCEIFSLGAVIKRLIAATVRLANGDDRKNRPASIIYTLVPSKFN